MDEVVLVVCPHPDDEINLVGMIMGELIKNSKDVYICFFTNGDYREYEYKARIKEAIRSCQSLGVDEEHIFFLGYPERCGLEKNIYNSVDGESFTSINGISETRCVSGHSEYCYVRWGGHNLVNRSNMTNDLKDLLLNVNPSVLICNDYDNHVDHKCLSLLLDEVIGTIINNTDNSPIVVKRYAYNGTWKGPRDYYSFRPTTMLSTTFSLNGKVIECFDSPYFDDSNKISIPTEISKRKKLLRNTEVFIAASNYRTQLAKFQAEAIYNTDYVFWLRRTDSLTHKCDIVASSGDYSFLSDFKLYDSSNILKEQEVFERQFDCGFWHPDDDDSEKKITFTFESGKTISHVIIYEYIGGDGCIIRGRLILNSGEKIVSIDFHNSKHAYVCVDVNCENVFLVEFVIDEYQGKQYGITEFEIYSNSDAILREKITRLFSSSIIPKNDSNLSSVIQHTEKISLWFSFLFHRIVRKVYRSLHSIFNYNKSC